MFPPRHSIKDFKLLSLFHFVAMSRVVNNNLGFLQLLADCPVHQRQLVLLRTATPQQIHALVQVLGNILMGHISIPEENMWILLSNEDASDLTWPHQMFLTKQRSESLLKRVVVLLKTYWPLLYQA